MPEYEIECEVNENRADPIRKMLDKRLAIMDKIQQAQCDKYDIEHELKRTIIDLKMYDCMTINYNILNKMIK